MNELEQAARSMNIFFFFFFFLNVSYMLLYLKMSPFTSSSDFPNLPPYPRYIHLKKNAIVESLNDEHIGTHSFILCREVVLSRRSDQDESQNIY